MAMGSTRGGRKPPTPKKRGLAAWIDQKWMKYKFNAKARIEVYASLGNYVQAGWPLTGAISQNYVIASRDGKCPNDPIAIVMDDWRRRMVGGMPFSEAIAPWVPENERVIVSSSEDSDLPKAVTNLQRIFSAKAQVRNAIFGSLSYPLFLVILCLGFIVFFRLFVVPSFADILPRSKWGYAPSILANFGDFLIDFGPLLLLLGAVLIGTVSWSLPNWTGKMRSKFDRLPPWSIYKIYQGASFMLMLSAMRAAGETDYGALTVMLKSASPWLKSQLEMPRRLTADGKPIGIALYITKTDFPDEKTVLNLRSYAALPNFAEVLEITGEKWLKDAVTKISKQMVFLNYFSLFMVAFTILGFLGTITSLAVQLISSPNTF